MAWVNAFSLGPCTLTVLKNSTVMTAGEMLSEGVTITESAGQVQMVFPENGQWYRAVVTPSYTTNSASIRLSGVSGSFSSPSNASIAAYWDSLATAQAFVFNKPGITPDPSAFPAENAWTAAGMSARRVVF
jgi:hypothetical protein